MVGDSLTESTELKLRWTFRAIWVDPLDANLFHTHTHVGLFYPIKLGTPITSKWKICYYHSNETSLSMKLILKKWQGWDFKPQIAKEFHAWTCIICQPTHCSGCKSVVVFTDKYSLVSGEGGGRRRKGSDNVLWVQGHQLFGQNCISSSQHLH